MNPIVGTAVPGGPKFHGTEHFRLCFPLHPAKPGMLCFVMKRTVREAGPYMIPSRKGSLRDFFLIFCYNKPEVRTMRDIGKNIRDLRTRKAMTQDELAEKLFVTRQTVSNYETGKSRPDIDMLMKIAEVLEVDIHEVLYGPSPRPDRKDEYTRFAIATGITVILWILMVVLEDYTRELYFSFHTAPRVLQYLLLCPTAFFFSGWTLMQLLSLFTTLRPLKGKYVSCFRWGVLILLIGGFLFMCPYYLDLICSDINYRIFKATVGSGEYTYYGFFKMTELHMLLYRILAKVPGILGLFGGALWLFGFPINKKN